MVQTETSEGEGIGPQLPCWSQQQRVARTYESPLELPEILHKGKLGEEVPVGTEEEKELFGRGTVLKVAAFFLRLPKPGTLGFHK